MANNDSTTVTNLEATPAVIASSATLRGKVRALVESVEVASGDGDGDTYTMFPVPLEARIDDIKVMNDAITGGTDYDAGFYRITTNNLGAEIDKDILFDGQSMASARASWTSLICAGTAALDQGAVKSLVWQHCGYASLSAARDANPTGEVYLVITANTVGSADGTLSVKLDITVE